VWVGAGSWRLLVRTLSTSLLLTFGFQVGGKPSLPAVAPLRGPRGARATPGAPRLSGPCGGPWHVARSGACRSAARTRLLTGTPGNICQSERSNLIACARIMRGRAIIQKSRTSFKLQLSLSKGMGLIVPLQTVSMANALWAGVGCAVVFLVLWLVVPRV
jgi:hypothetical protein